ncbi:MAG: 2-C-methyl-D-erythritol 2,4-cyclodiphosphate synthase [Gemmatimonadales bacterium]|nr:2-C-methyl-D-erythritol 2,4-cyclodiphosphate synthase [Gemmatimonadales bacterium]NIN11627.1 2-C-methyl-D-erythritol 2,4-cyclodiphosphate synthase [Gemmatimonadales bacterium]NIN50233.1 2-C-methyl-D-erythritol 2,4-cyclodiphosphate synthase [Gemmatimonadales bacterium]NIP07697.1 2-C-methyl-D-erythritol 2,4-cyclodiphosphate synthase [Gemmatimonadales bacterium]NIR01849.1 2-C-methyl-D-erythritol 2,4-cyclodiphosphate synthase [Gemmatimonadales bacterium]
MRQRFGIGYDSHVFVDGRPLVLGGLKIDHPMGLQGHSDGDAVAHAVIDALLGAAAMGDIGRHFPDDDERWKDADSMKLLSEVRRRVIAASYTVVNVDVTVITEAPKLAPFIDAMRENVSQALGLPISAVSIKAKTNEKMDSVGQGQGLQVLAIASLGGA